MFFLLRLVVLFLLFFFSPYLSVNYILSVEFNVGSTSENGGKKMQLLTETHNIYRHSLLFALSNNLISRRDTRESCIHAEMFLHSQRSGILKGPIFRDQGKSKKYASPC